MSGEQRRRLATAAAGAGYPGALLQSIAQGTLANYAAGRELVEQQLGQVADAVELLAEAGLSAEQVGAPLAACRRRAPEGWRERFWVLVVRVVRAQAHCGRGRAGSSQVS
jgi:hypothetical protein